MNSKTLRAKYLKFAILIISVCFILGAISACLPFNISVPTLDNDTIINTATNITQNDADGLGEFDDGYFYMYTDRELVDGFRAGTKEADITVQKVAKTDENRGTKENPYVISTVADWETFVKMCGVNLANSNGKYFVLANDIDFTGETFHPVGKFGGTFYGRGFKFLNVTCSNWVYWNSTTNVYNSVGTSGQTNSGFGIFCSATNATITDFISEDFTLSNIPNTTASGVNTSGATSSTAYGPYIGGLVGITFGNCNILNCQTVGEIIGGSSYGNTLITGGVVGTNTISGNNRNTYFYRCSTEFTATSIYSSVSVMIGAIIGQSWSGLTIFDCVANAIMTTTASRGYCTAFGWSETTTCPFQLENVIGKIDITGGISSGGGVITGLRGANQSVSNAYGAGNIGTTTKNSIYPITHPTTAVASFIKSSNINVVKSSSSYATPLTGVANAVSSFTEYSTTDAMLTKAEEFFSDKQYSNIWDTSKIKSEDWTPDNSPVRSYLMAFINFRNLIDGGNDEEGVNIVDGEAYLPEDALPTPDSNSEEFADFLDYVANKERDNHEFLGWTDDPTGESDPFVDLPSGKFGSVTLYAVWTLPESYIAGKVTTNLTSDKATIEYDSVEAITLTANVNHSFTIMTNPSTKYHFLQDGENKVTDDEEVKTSGMLSVKTVADTGTYTFTYRVADGLEPLWRYDGKPTNSVDIEIEKGKLANMSIDDFQISSATVPYYGKTYENIDFTVKLFNRSDIEVELANMEWQSTLGKVDVKGTNTRNIIVSPVDTNNYETQYVFSVSFESQSLVMIFNLEQIHKTIEVEVEYGQNYGANEIIYLFQQAYLVALSTWDADTVKDVSSMAPYLDGKSLTDNDANADKYDTEYNGIDKIHTIEVTFKYASYEVIFNPNNGGATQPTQEAYGYGLFLRKPNDPVNGDLLFVGWYFDDVTVDENGNNVTTNRAWRFNSVGDIPQDRVTKAVTLTAKWLKADTLVSIKVEVDPSKKYMAQTSLQEGDLIVTATYSGEVDGQSIEQDVVLSWSDFASSIKYSTIDNQMHVTDGGYEVTVSFTYGSSTQSGNVQINVLPISVNTSKLTFADKTIVYDGTDTNVTIEPIKGTLPTEITNVKYVYTRNGQEVDVSTVKGVGTWVVQAVFETDSADYYAEPMFATLKVVRPTALEKPTFTGGVTYDGTEKNIEDYLNGYDPDFMQIVGSGATGTEVGRYTVTIQLTDGTWADGTTGNVTINWTIDKATLIPEWDNWEFIASDTSNGFAPVISSIAQGLASGDSVDYAT
ncbi:MAG: InlB B-repeat-containing protein, partial [Clostridia bacterium]|nr:InlB B-repeat-containing protein [Clostridia bacterium]